MSYEYARIPLNLGLNIVCGPNGAGKSSILLAISVALGQAFTERGRKFSDLIRWGEDTARVTLTFDNKYKDGIRPIPKFNTDYLRLSRYLKIDGNYWFQANFQTITKGEVIDLLSDLGINPDNMLIIMHQHMMMEFGITTPQQKLLMVEEAVGFNKYRENLFEAQKKLSQVLSEEESISNLLKNAEVTLDYWKGEYDRYLKRKELILKKDFLERELSWAEIIKHEKIVEGWKWKIQRKKEELITIETEMDEAKRTIVEQKKNLNKLRNEQNEIYHSLLALERDKIGTDETINTFNNLIEKIKTQKTLPNGFLLQTLLMESNNKDDFLKSFSEDEIFKHSWFEKKYAELINHSESIQIIETRLSELQTKSQLLKQEADKQENEKKILEKLVKDKENKEKTLQQERKRFDELSAINNQISPMLKTLDEATMHLNLEKTRRDEFIKELNGLIKRVPSAINIKLMDDPSELANELLYKLQTKTDARKTIGEEIKKITNLVESLINEEQRIIVEIGIWENEINKLSKQRSEIQQLIEGTLEKSQMRCDKCGSILTPKQWSNLLNEIEKKMEGTEQKVSATRLKLGEIQENILKERKLHEQLRNEEQIIEKMIPISLQTRQLLDDIKNSYKNIKKYEDEQEQINANIIGLIQGDKANLNQRVRDIQTEMHTLKLEIPRREKELVNFEELFITPQHERVEIAVRASENYQKILPKLIEDFKLYIAKIWLEIQSANQKKSQLEEKIFTSKSEFEKIEENVKSITESYQVEREKEALLTFQQKNIIQEINELNSELDTAQRELAQ
ncbi:MAG: AAA family ATPase, partial [Candidatus Hermodarchaeota archaeon]